MALIYQLLRVLVLGVTAAAVDDVPITWSQSVRNASLPCVVPEWTRVQPRRPPPPLDDDLVRSRPYTWFRVTTTREDVITKRISHNGTLEVVRKNGGSTEGVYQCAASHHGGVVLGYPVNLKFSFIGKQFSNPPSDTTAYLNQPTSIPCRISSGPAASISWLKDGRPLPQNQRYFLLESELLIIDVQNEDAGAYRCIATNPYVNKSRTSSEGRVTVIDSKDEEPSFLALRVEDNIAVPRRSRVVLPCPVRGWPRPKLRWELTPPGEKTSELETTEEVLVLNNLEYDQEGVYTCSLEDYLDMVKTFNVTLTEPVAITLPPVSKDVTRASTVRFNCTASGKPEPNVTWYKNGEKLTLAGRRNLRSSVDRKRLELVISGVTSDDAGVYQCFAWNGHSMASKWARLNVTGAGADAPRAVTCAPASAAAVALRWLPPAEQVMAYTVDTTPTDKHGGAITGQPHTNTEEIIKVREPLTPYLFQVRAYIPASAKKNIASDMSESVLCQGQGVPIKLSKLEDDKILVSWKQFAEQTPGVVQWILQYKPDDGTGDTQEHNITLAAHVTNYTLMAPESEPLRVRLLGSKTLEWLPQNLTLVPWTSTSAAGQDTDDGEVKVIPQDLEVTEVSERSFTLRWRCEDSTRYTFLVCVRRVDGNDDCQESYETSTKIEGLQPDSKYEVRVQVRVPGRALGGAFTAPYFVTTLSKGPHRFKDLKYKYINASTIRVSWSDAPARYTVYHSAELKLPVEQWAALEIVGNTVLITGIEPTEETFVMVTGYEPLGHSPILNVPPQVRNLEDKDLKYAYTSSGVSVWWNGTGPRVVRFTQNITQPVENWTTVNVTGTSVELNNLNAGPVFVMVTALGGERRRYPTALTIPERPPNHYYYYLGIGVGCGACALCAVAGGALCLWRRAKAKRTPQRSRRTHTTTAEGNEEEGSEMRMARVANGGAGEPLLNGHVHITENPASKTPNGRLKKARHYQPPHFDAFDVSRHEPDTTVETVLDDTTAFSLLDTSRQPEHGLSRPTNLSPNNSFNKLPDDNMNSELTRSTEFQLDNSKIQPTLQPNG
ncbi:protogenin-like isoform X1 [Maniola jurtina]|uniref:protogenin-like isoform X1 n=1 Tax=Maniola jurtina TaxID=191418 RepID=UPI001E68F3B9|nr:protogenin-like isoform X1 [Maniola jurtina]